MDENTVNEQARNMTKAIFHKESNLNYDAVGDNGTSRGAGQWQPDTWKAQAKEVLGDEHAEMTPDNQSVVAQGTIRKLIKEGKNAAQIAAIWNSGSDKNWEHKIGRNEKLGVDYNVPKYVKEVTDKYQELKGGSVAHAAAQPEQTDLTKDPIVGGDDSLKAPGAGIADVVPGANLAKGLAYAIGGGKAQKGLLESQDEAMDIQANLLKRIKEKKARGEDTARLERALAGISENISDVGGKVSDAGTGGITNKQVLKSAGSLATLPLASYAKGAVSGGGLLNKARGLQTGVLGKAEAVLPKALQSEAVKELTVLGKGETLGSLSRQELMTTLENGLKEMKTSQIGTKYEADIMKAIKGLSPSEQQSLVRRLTKQGINLAKGAIVTGVLAKTLGKTKIGGLIKDFTR